MIRAEGTRAEAKADLEELWAAISRLYRARSAVGTSGAEAVGLALTAEDLVHADPAGALATVRRAWRLLEDLGEPAA